MNQVTISLKILFMIIVMCWSLGARWGNHSMASGPLFVQGSPKGSRTKADLSGRKTYAGQRPVMFLLVLSLKQL